MKSIACLTILISLTGNVFSQDMSVNAGIRAISSTNLSETLHAPRHYRYKQFQKGRIVYRDGKTSEDAKFNYDFVSSTMLMIGPSGDTVTVLKKDEIDHYKVANEIFLTLPEGIVEVNSSNRKIKLGVCAKYAVKRVDPISNNGYVSSYDPTGGSMTRGVIRVIMDNSFTYYICMDNNTVFKATRKKVIKAFKKKVPKIKEYIDMCDLDFKSVKELEILVAYLNSNVDSSSKDTTHSL